MKLSYKKSILMQSLRISIIIQVGKKIFRWFGNKQGTLQIWAITELYFLKWDTLYNMLFSRNTQKFHSFDIISKGINRLVNEMFNCFDKKNASK